jgi:hypothetical protein
LLPNFFFFFFFCGLLVVNGIVFVFEVSCSLCGFQA